MTVPVIEVWPEAQQNAFFSFRRGQYYYSSVGRGAGDFFAGLGSGILAMVFVNVVGVLAIIGFSVFLLIVGRGWMAGGLLASLAIAVYILMLLLGAIVL